MRRLNLDAIIGSDRVRESDLGLDFATFILRYYRTVSYDTFSTDEVIQNKIKRAEIYRAWADIEDLAHGFEAMSGNFTAHQKTVSKAFGEVHGQIEQFKQEMQQNQQTVTQLNRNNQSLHSMQFRNEAANASV